MTDDEREALLRNIQAELSEGRRAFKIDQVVSDRIVELLEYNNHEVERRRAAIEALRTVLARIEGTTAATWLAPNARERPEAQYLGTLADFLRAAIAEENR